MAKRKFKEGDLVTFNQTEQLPKSGVVISFAHYSPTVKAHAQGARIPFWNILCNNGKKHIIGEEVMRLVNRNETSI